MFILNIVSDKGFPTCCTTEFGAVGGVVVKPPGTVSLKKYISFVVNPENISAVKPVI